jgi:hypothetical protein
LQLWEQEVFGESGVEAPSLECIWKLLHRLSAVG